mgnify:CR=1 FL=1
MQPRTPMRAAATFMRIVIFVGLCWAALITASSCAAADWVYLQRLEGTRYGACTEYIDASSVLNDGTVVSYWTIWVFDEASAHHPVMKMLWKKEAPLPGFKGQRRILERYYFDAANREIQRYLEPIKDYGDRDDEIRIALGYSRPGKTGRDAPPDHILTPSPRWYGYVLTAECDLYWDVRSIVSWPRNEPTEVDIRVKKVWHPEAIDKRKADIRAKFRYQQSYDGLTYTVANYRFLLQQGRCRILEETDFTADGRRLTVVDGTDWQTVEAGSTEEIISSIALRWLANDEESR